ncbi:MAG: bifunctional phosphopantothenoylcysteine decarboxylase/phosphopantothenate--cysteine ligase CoaBC [Gammaproteobacteria bacterium]|nr:bifunctional phosphopantothenoylcysteine decarboxylase/phosphopantothenate--cysteine ligase CoaBC [Gammaproteobacteria bacterium]
MKTTSEPSGLSGKHILLAVSAGIAAYKAPLIVRTLRAVGAQVQVVLSANAHHFVTPTTLQAVAGSPVRQDMWDEAAEAAMGHIELARWADIVLVAPATANTLAKLAHGMADDLLSTTCLATQAPVVVAPAMNQHMYQHPATQANLKAVQALGYHIVGPDSGEQACGDDGPGRMSQPDELVAFLASLQVTSVLSGYRVMVTAGPTLEPIDPVRYISNHSSGLQGLSIAEAAKAAGAEVILIAGPRVAASSAGIQRLDVVTALEMQSAVQEHLHGIDIFIGVAAVADYRPKLAAGKKIKRSGGESGSLSLEFVENPDIIAGVAQHRPKPLVIGFAAETNNTLEHARTKRIRKQLDAIVLNDVADPSIGFNSPHNAATLIFEHGEITLPKQTKRQLADTLISQLVLIFASQLANTNPESMSE